jgi:hypothetical protein
MFMKQFKANLGVFTMILVCVPVHPMPRTPMLPLGMSRVPKVWGEFLKFFKKECKESSYCSCSFEEVLHDRFVGRISKHLV